MIVNPGYYLDISGFFKCFAPYGAGFAIVDAMLLPQCLIVKWTIANGGIILIVTVRLTLLLLLLLLLLGLLVHSGQRVHHPTHHWHISHGLPQ